MVATNIAFQKNVYPYILGQIAQIAEHSIFTAYTPLFFNAGSEGCSERANELLNGCTLRKRTYEG